MTLRKLVAPFLLSALAGCAHISTLPARVDVCSTVAPIIARVADRVNGPTAGAPGAFTVGGVTFYLRPPDPALERHEAVHREQQKRLGEGFYAAYLLLHVTRGYDGNPLEQEAREAE